MRLANILIMPLPCRYIQASNKRNLAVNFLVELVAILDTDHKCSETNYIIHTSVKMSEVIFNGSLVKGNLTK